MINPKPKFKQSSNISEKPGYLSGKLKTLASSNYHRDFFFLKFSTYFLLNSVYKRALGIFYLTQILELLKK